MEEGDDIGRTPGPKRRRSLLGKGGVTPGPAPDRDDRAARTSDADRVPSFIGVGGVVADGLDPAEPVSVEGRRPLTTPTIAPVDLGGDISSLETPIRAPRDEESVHPWPSGPSVPPSAPAVVASVPESGPSASPSEPSLREAAPTQPISMPKLVEQPVTQAVQWLVLVGAAALLVALVAVIAIGGSIGGGDLSSTPASPVSLEPSMLQPTTPAVVPNEPEAAPVPSEPAPETPAAHPPEVERGKVKLPKLRLGKKKDGG